MKYLAAWFLAVHTLSACGRPDRPTGTGSGASARRVDSLIPIEESLRRFRANAPNPDSLSGGADSREKLVRGFARAVETLDTAALRRMLLQADEFAWLYYPSSPVSRPPYELAPDLMWFRLQGESSKGATRLLAKLGGRPFRYVGHSCGPPEVQGEARIYANCAVRRVGAEGDTLAQRLFGLIIERDNSHKFVSYANRLD